MLKVPVNVVFGVVWVVVVDDKLDVVDVQPSGGDVCSYQDGSRTVFELSQHPVPLLLLLVAVNAHGGVAVTSHQSGQVVGFPLGLNKDQNLVLGLATDLFQQPVKCFTNELTYLLNFHQQLGVPI